MIIVEATTREVVYDFFLTLGLSLVTWLCYHTVCLLLRMKNKIVEIVLHLLFFSAAAVVWFCFIVGQTASQVPRWHMVVGFVLGAWIYYAWFARYLALLHRGVLSLLRLFARPFIRLGKFVAQKLLLPAQNRLQKWYKMRYNAHVKARAQRKARRSKDNGKEQPQTKEKKEPVKAYTQT